MSSIQAEIDSTEPLRSSPIDGYASPAPQLTPPGDFVRKVNFPRKLLMSQSAPTACQNAEDEFGVEPYSQIERTSPGPETGKSSSSEHVSTPPVEDTCNSGHKRPVPCDWTDGEGEQNTLHSRQSTSLTSPQTSSDGSPFLSLLARDHGPLGNLPSSTSFAATLATLESLVPKLRHRYELELDLVRGQVAERDLAIERLRARLRPKRSKP